MLPLVATPDGPWRQRFPDGTERLAADHGAAIYQKERGVGSHGRHQQLRRADARCGRYA
ncbi:hypothetical protein MPS_1165 [Mycobacterium pseudoshottsii JCM 15466]|nr:hypothetical protein MPS_1165 [Mycobacterium pseudoshottsii JCM 15466]